MICFIFLFCNAAVSSAEKEEQEILAAMKKATAFMMNNVAYNGGFVWRYSQDLTKRWGEIPARDTQIWVQGATNDVGEMLLDAYEVTGDRQYLDYAEEVAGAILWGQHTAGGWHYLIDFDIANIQLYYDNVASLCWGWEEYYHYYGNCTFDDSATSSSIQLLMQIYSLTQDSRYRAPLMKALDFVLEAQFPNGAWPQRYPLMDDFQFNGKADYTSFYTFNDEVIYNNIMLLLDAYDMFGDKRIKDAAIRGMDFYIISQTGYSQGGWCEQYSHDMKPAQARSYEPAGVYTGTTLRCIKDLELFYMITGDTRYLNPIDRAISWLENSVINTDPSKKYTHAYIYETGSNKPIYSHRFGTSKENGGYVVDYKIGDPVCHYPQVTTVDIEKVKNEYRRISAMTPEQAREEYVKMQESDSKYSSRDNQQLTSLIDALDSRGAWVTDVRIPNYDNTCANNRQGTVIKGIDTRVFVQNMYCLMNCIRKNR